MLHQLEIGHRTVFVDDKLSYYPTLYFLLLGRSRVFQILREPLHEFRSATRKLWQILYHTYIDGGVIHIYHLGLLWFHILGCLWNLLTVSHIANLWGYLHIFVHQSQFFALGLLRHLLLRQHHGNLVLAALQRFQFEFSLQIVVLIEESPAVVVAVPFQRHEKQGEHEDKS